MKTVPLSLGYLLLVLAVGCTLEDPASPIAKAVPSKSSCTAPCTVSFTDASENTGIYSWSYQWDFGDGNSSTEKNPTHTYQKTGTYKVVYTLSGKYGNAMDSTVLVSVLSNPPVASFKITGGNCAAPCEVTFTNSSQNATTYLWNFGDKSPDSTSTVANPKHTYQKAGKFLVKLTASKDGAISTKIDTVVIKPTVVLPMSNFSYVQDTTHADFTVVTFTNLSANATTYAWEFGDGKSSVLKDPQNTYKRESGKDTSYLVKLHAYANGVTTVEAKSITIKKK